MASNQPLKKTPQIRPVPLYLVTRKFWTDVRTRLVKTHRVSPLIAQRAIRIYKRRVGNIAMNSGVLETAGDIASAVKSGGFVRVRRTTDGKVVQRKIAV